MKTEEFFLVLGDLDPRLIEGANVAKKKRTFNPQLQIILAASVTIVLGIAISNFSKNQTSSPEIPNEIVFDTAYHLRKFFNFNGYRYAFLNNGATYNKADFIPKQFLGTLDYNLSMPQIENDPNIDVKQNFATTFAFGGSVWEIEGYHPGFRVAVEWQGGYYLADMVAKTDDSPLSVSYFLEVSDLQNQIQSINIFIHSESDALASISSIKDLQTIVAQLSLLKHANLSNDQYEVMAKGSTYLLKINLIDGTFVECYLVPSLNVISLGDGYYYLPKAFIENYFPWIDEMAMIDSIYD